MNKWLAELPKEQPIYAQDWSVAQTRAVFEKVAADKRDYAALRAALERADERLCSLAEGNAQENIDPALTEDCFGYWREMRRQLAHAAAAWWSDSGRDLNAELGMVVY